MNYLQLSKASDLDNPKDRAIYRLFEIFPGALSWATLFGGIILSWIAPAAVAIFIIAFDFYWLLRIVYLAFHQIASYRRMRRYLKTDWVEKLNSLEPAKYSLPVSHWREIYHLIILPLYKEKLEIVKTTLQSLIASAYPKDKMIIVLAVEERGGEPAREVAEKIKEEFDSRFFRFLVTFHPGDIPGEIAGKGSNVNWAFNKARKVVENELSIPKENIIVSDFDIDTRVYPQYFSCLTWHYLTVKKPLRASYQPIPVYNNNIWQAPAFTRVIATSNTFWQMMQEERPEQLVTYSSHSLPFKLLEEVGYPANMVSDDSRIFWKAYLYYNGDYRAIPLYYPVSMDAVLAKNLKETIINQYKQQRRWAWGVENIPYLLYGFLKNKKIPLFDKLRHSFIIIEGFWAWATVALLIFFLGWLPLILGGKDFNVTLLSYNLPRLTSNLMTIAMIGMIVSAIISMSLLPPRPPKYSRWRNLSMILQWTLLPITLIVFGAFPALDAQTRLLGERYMGFWNTEKFRGETIVGS